MRTRTREDMMKELLAEVLEDPAKLDPRTRRAAAANTGASDGPEAGATGGQPDRRGKAVRALADKVHTGAWKMTDADIQEAKSAGLSEDEIFEAVISAAIGAGKKRFDAAMAALAAANSPAKKAVAS